MNQREWGKMGLVHWLLRAQRQIYIYPVIICSQAYHDPNAFEIFKSNFINKKLLLHQDFEGFEQRQFILTATYMLLIKQKIKKERKIK